ncbi:3,4-dihydroxy-2-butanone-4-phosphate synthase [Oxyplasma meridianum]|uniref:3,4-dihydroxy-2-butanone 4-phosphate synthase n=1 Tax=Oxyplasma meridianum TaxID=3073602 RepID=A0AAX4NGV9_9ARCH
MFNREIADLRSGKPIMIFDFKDREGETDLVIPSQFVNTEIIRFFRKQGGGLICTTMKEEIARTLHLPFLDDLYRKFLYQGTRLADASDMKYDKTSSFTVTINHRDTFTGVSDHDRSKTINEFSNFISEMKQLKNDPGVEFSKRFRSPGHVILLIAREGYFSVRKGHTELSTYMVEKAGLIPSATIVETLSDSGKSMSRDEAMEFARSNKLNFIDGSDIVSEWLEDESNGIGSIRYNTPGAYTLSQGIKKIG